MEKVIAEHLIGEEKSSPKFFSQFFLFSEQSYASANCLISLTLNSGEEIKKVLYAGARVHHCARGACKPSPRTPVASHGQSPGSSPDHGKNTEVLVRDIATVIDDTLDGIRRIADLVTGFSRLTEFRDIAKKERIKD